MKQLVFRDDIGEKFKSQLVEEASNLGTTIKNLRRALGISQAEFGKLIKRDRSYVSKVELSTISPKFDVLQSIALIFNMKTYELIIQAHLENGLPKVTEDITRNQTKQISKWIDNQLQAYIESRKDEKLLDVNHN